MQTLRKLFDLLDRRERRNALLLLSLMLLQGVVEMAGVASIYPFMAVLANPTLVDSNPYLSQVYARLGFTSHASFLVLLAVAALAVIMTRIAVTAFTSYATARYAQLRSFTLSTRLLENYLSRPYAWFLNHHSSGMAKAVLSEVEEVVSGSLMRSFDLIAQGIVAACLVSLVLFVETRVAVTAILLVGAGYGTIYLLLRNYLGRIGTDRFVANRQRFQIANEMLSGIKDVKIRGLEHTYLRRFSGIAHRFARRKATYVALNQLPRHVMEALAIGSLMTIVLLLLINARGDLSKALPVLALYAFAGLRLIPKVQSIYGNLVSLRFNSHALEDIHRDLTESGVTSLPAAGDARLSLNRVLELRHVTFTYPEAERPALIDVSLSIYAKTTVGLVGSTGAGKTTLADVILGLLEPQQGEIIVDGRAIAFENIRGWQQGIGYVPQQIFLIDDSIAANVAFGVPSHKIDMKAVERACRMAELHAFVEGELPQSYATAIGERGVRLSGGQRQRIGIARALYHDPALLVLDEATSSLDNLTEQAVMDALRNLANLKTIVIIAHRLSTIRACDELFLLEQGRLKASGSYQVLVDKDSVFRQMAAREPRQETV
jgi:ABC-type multidrug transport system fused ATPase/permease subunit